MDYMNYLEQFGQKIYYTLRLASHPSLIPYRAKGGDVSSFLQLDKKWIRDFGFKTVLDIGANIGSFSQTISQLIPGVQIHAFEPIPEAYNQMVERMQAYPHFKAHNCGLGNQDGHIDFHLNQSATSSSFLPQSQSHRDAFPHTSHGTKIMQVKIARLDDLISENDLALPMMAKIDVQGYEREVLDGGHQTIRNAELILIETSFVELYEGQVLFPEIYERLVSWGYEYAGALHQHMGQSDGRIMQSDSIFVRKSIA